MKFNATNNYSKDIPSSPFLNMHAYKKIFTLLDLLLSKLFLAAIGTPYVMLTSISAPLFLIQRKHYSKKKGCANP
jgi:hypothetical protein